MKSYYCTEEEDCCHLEEMEVVDLCKESEVEEDPIKSIMLKASSLLMSLSQNRKKWLPQRKKLRQKHTMDHAKAVDKPGEVVNKGKVVWEADFEAETEISADKYPQTKEATKPPVRYYQPDNLTVPSTFHPSAGATIPFRKKRRCKKRIFYPDGSFRRITVWKY